MTALEGEGFHISLTAHTKPFYINTSRSVPFAYCDKLKADTTVTTNHCTATEWCAPIIVTPKKNLEIMRMWVDLSNLNRFVVWERYQSLTPTQAVADITASDAKLFTVINALKGYHQCPLYQQS